MEAGVEHLGRGTASAVDAFIVVVEPGRRSLQTAHTIHALAADLGIKRVYAVGNKVASPSDEEFIRAQLPGFHILGFLPGDERAIEADRSGRAVYDLAPELVSRARAIADQLEDR
jgi:CO dehydrogenase maturation factor